jgi:signal transduction histidine kinase
MPAASGAWMWITVTVNTAVVAVVLLRCRGVRITSWAILTLCYGSPEGWIVSSRLNPLAVRQALTGLTCSFLFVFMVAAIRMAARRLDRATARETAAHIDRRAAGERVVTVNRLHGEIHDRVLPILRAAASGQLGADSDRLGRISAETRETLDRFDLARLASVALSPADLAQALAKIVATRAGVATWMVSGSRPIPAAACEVLQTSVSEALRNSERHARGTAREITRLAEIEIAEDWYQVTILDNGAGFVEGSLPSAAGFGLANIRQIMAGVRVGEAVIVSDAAGTRVTMSWRRPDTDA